MAIAEGTHPKIGDVIKAFDDGITYLVMEVAEGQQEAHVGYKSDHGWRYFWMPYSEINEVIPGPPKDALKLGAPRAWAVDRDLGIVEVEIQDGDDELVECYFADGPYNTAKGAYKLRVGRFKIYKRRDVHSSLPDAQSARAKDLLADIAESDAIIQSEKVRRGRLEHELAELKEALS